MGVFLQHGGQLIEMHEAPYEAESVLQSLLADHPGLLAGDGAERHRWLLVKREAALPDAEEGGARWSVDHLFLDAEGTPTIVEVKRSSDTRLRREVVGQMLDYAANAAAYWRADRLRTYFEARAEEEGGDPEELLADALGVGDPDAFWARVDTNLAAGRLRLVFVGDLIPVELRRIVEYLNAEMSSAEVLALEVKQYVETDGERRTLVSRTIGQTEAAKQVKASRPRVRGSWDQDSILADLGERCGDRYVEIARRLLRWAADHEPPVEVLFGSGRTYSSMQFGLSGPNFRIFPFFLYATGSIEIQFGLMGSYPYEPFQEEAMRLELAKRLEEIEGVVIDRGRISARPGFDLALLADEQSMRRFLAAIEWSFAAAREHAEGASGEHGGSRA